MVKAFKFIIIFVISNLLLTQGSVNAEVDTSMIGVEKYQKFDYLQTKFIGDFHRLVVSFAIDGERLFSEGLLSRSNHIFSIRIRDVPATDSGSSLYCEYARDDILSGQDVCSLDQGITGFSPIVYIDWVYWEDYLNERGSGSNSTTWTFKIINNDNEFGYT